MIKYLILREISHRFRINLNMLMELKLKKLRELNVPVTEIFLPPERDVFAFKIDTDSPDLTMALLKDSNLLESKEFSFIDEREYENIAQEEKINYYNYMKIIEQMDNRTLDSIRQMKYTNF